MNPKPIPPECPDVFTIEFGRELVAYLGGDAGLIGGSWCWKDFKIYKDLLPAAMKYFENATTGDPVYAAYRLWFDCGAPKVWYEAIKRKWEKPQ